jgi:peptidoglycan/xylan/chitin deacetylase (PgdA/CDA1 family)
MFHLLNPLEVRAYALEGFDFQLHTHRHRNVVDNLESIAAELMENKERIIELTGKEPKHFAYPSGRWNKQAWLQLQKSGVISAVTMDAGLNYADADHLCLRRIFDSESNWQVEFEWITCGIKENIYSVVAQFRHLLGVKK